MANPHATHDDVAAIFARLGEEPGAPNIDGWSVDPDDIGKLAQVLVGKSREAGRIMFPARPAGYARETKNLARYAWNKATAMRCRAGGKVNEAAQYESICDRIYARLPEFARW